MKFTQPFTSIEELTKKLDDSGIDLNSVPSGSWSVLQHLYHCWMVEKGVLAYIKLKTQTPSALESITMYSRLKFLFFFMLLRLKLLRVNAPDVVQQFPENMQISNLIRDWEQTREEADLFFQDLPKNIAQKGIFRHIFIGRLNKKWTQKFIQLHLRHHLRLCGL